MLRPRTALLGFLVAGLLGCGGAPQPVSVTGRVTYNGAPLNKPGGTIVFVGPDGSQVPATIGADGTYRAEGVTPGPNRVAVSYPNPRAQQNPSRTPPPTQETPDPPPKTPPPFLTPAAYAAADTSGLSVVVEPGSVYGPALTGPPIK